MVGRGRIQTAGDIIWFIWFNFRHYELDLRSVDNAYVPWLIFIHKEREISINGV